MAPHLFDYPRLEHCLVLYSALSTVLHGRPLAGESKESLVQILYLQHRLLANLFGKDHFSQYRLCTTGSVVSCFRFMITFHSLRLPL